jgi:gamma-glutamylcyclotransferase (GGCT)/AIG2-like uncharacterized protein YtfP
VRGRLYALSPGYPGLRPGLQKVEGDVLSFDDDALFAQLDHLEGFDPSRPVSEDFEYTREPCEAFSPEGTSLGTVWAYWILPSRLSHYEAIAVERWDHLAPRAECIRTVRAHTASFECSPKVFTGERVTCIREDARHPGWFFGQDARGVEGYFPLDWFTVDAEGAQAIARFDYDAAELSLAAGCRVEVEQTAGSWSLVRSGEQRGWIPTACLTDPGA